MSSSPFLFLDGFLVSKMSFESIAVSKKPVLRKSLIREASDLVKFSVLVLLCDTRFTLMFITKYAKQLPQLSI